jgi:hypothetical protein
MTRAISDALHSSNHPPGAPWSVADAASFLGISARHLNRLLRGSRVLGDRIGRRVLLPDSEVRRLAEMGDEQVPAGGTLANVADQEGGR